MENEQVIERNPKNVKRLAYLTGILSFVAAGLMGILIGFFASIPLSGVGGQYMGRPFFGALFGVVSGIIYFAGFINLLGHLFKVRKEAIAFIVTPPARFTKGKGVNISLLIATMAVVLSIGVILNVFSFNLPGFGGQASFVYLFMYLSGILFGPVYGFAVAFFADFIGCIIAPVGVYSPLIGVSNGITATIVALVFKLRFSNKFYKDLLLIVFTFICIATIMSAYYFGSYYAGGNPITNDAGEVIGLTGGSGLHNGARVVIIAATAALLIWGLYKIISIKTHDVSGKERPQWFLKLILGAIIAFVPASLVLTSYGLFMIGAMQELPFELIILARLISQPVWVGINLLVLYVFIPSLNRSVLKYQPIV